MLTFSQFVVEESKLVNTLKKPYHAAKNAWELVNMISQVQNAKKSMGTPISAAKAYRILKPKAKKLIILK